jgi:Big-like domain-containing protein
MHHGYGEDRLARPSIAGVLCLVLAMTLAGLFTTASGPGSAEDRSISLYATTLGGWSTAPGEERDPGPALAVTRGDHVTINLTSEDGLEHGLFIDYNGNGLVDIGVDYISPRTASTTTFSFDPDRTGDFDYCDQLVLLNCGQWSTKEPNRPPVATIQTPTTGVSWTEGFAHEIVFNVSDPDGDAVTVVLSYTHTGGTVPESIAPPFAAGPNPNRYSWTPTGFHAPDTIVHLVARDPSGLSTSVDSPAFEVDDTVPTVVSMTPARGAASVDRGTGITVGWSEEMNPASGAPDTFAVQVQDGPWIAGTVAWSIDHREMTFLPTSTLSASTTYVVQVNATARDSSDPGNAFTGPDTWTFRTNSGTDTNRPTILGVQADPTQKFADAPVNLTADVQDDVGVVGVSAMISASSFSENVTMAHLSGTRWYVNRTFVEIGRYDVVVWATDNAGNPASQAFSFDISPRGNPNVLAPSSVRATPIDGFVEVTWTPVSFPGLSGYHVYRSDSATGPFHRLTISPLRATAPTVYRDGPETGRTYFYTVTAVNATGAESAYAPSSRVTVPPYQPSPLLNPVPWAIAGVTLAVILGVLYGTIWRRRLA